jgi:hypothetical protein
MDQGFRAVYGVSLIIHRSSAPWMPWGFALLFPPLSR